MAKCKRLKKQLKLKEEIAGLDPNVIIESKEDEGRPKRSTRKATQRNYIFEEPMEKINQEQEQQVSEVSGDASQLLQKIKGFIDSDSDYESVEQNKNSNNVDPSNMVEANITANDANALPEQILNVAEPIHESHPIQPIVDVSLVNAQCTTTLQPM